MISVFTPTHNLCWLHETYASLRAQTLGNWEWIIVPNGQARGHVHNFGDDRVKVFNAETSLDGNIGALKKLACQQASGSIVLELDHDDLLTSDAIEEVTKAFDDQSVDFVYSNFVAHDFRVDYPMTFNGLYGWTHRPFIWGGRFMLETVSADPYPQSISRIWYAPNHLRAWRKSFYDRIGGHASDLKVSDDHDLICRTYIEGKMLHLDKPLYIYRVTGENEWLKHQEEIQKTQWACYDRHIERMVEKWCNGKGLSRWGIEEKLPENGYAPLDLNDLPSLDDSTAGSIRATDVFQLCTDPVRMMNECWRVLAHGGFLFITVPSSDGVGAYDNPLNQSFWNWRSFRYYTEREMQAKLPGSHCRFQKVKVETVTTPEGVRYCVAHLIAVKDESPRFSGELLI